MKKAINVGIASGIIISILFIASSLIRKWVPRLAFENRGVYLLFMACLVAVVFWMSMRYYSRSQGVRWGSLNLTGLIASFFAAIIFSTAGFLYTRFIDPNYLLGMVDRTEKNWLSHNALAGYAGNAELPFFQSPSIYAWNNFQELLFGLLAIALVTCTIFYVTNKNKTPDHPHDSHELIF